MSYIRGGFRGGERSTLINRASLRGSKTSRLAIGRHAEVETATLGRLVTKHMIARGQPLAQFGPFWSGQHGMSSAMVTAVESTVVARAGATKEPTINPRIASIARVRVIANHGGILRNCQNQTEMTR